MNRDEAANRDRCAMLERWTRESGNHRVAGILIQEEISGKRAAVQSGNGQHGSMRRDDQKFCEMPAFCG